MKKLSKELIVKEKIIEPEIIPDYINKMVNDMENKIFSNYARGCGRTFAYRILRAMKINKYETKKIK